MVNAKRKVYKSLIITVCHDNAVNSSSFIFDWLINNNYSGNLFSDYPCKYDNNEQSSQIIIIIKKSDFFSTKMVANIYTHVIHFIIPHV